MKEMIYSIKPKREVLSTGFCFGLLYFVLNLGSHPAAYIRLPNNSKINLNDIYVHGGITYLSNELRIDDNEKLDGKFIGWDYAHMDDYLGCELIVPEEYRVGGKRWTTEEIYQEVREVCYQIRKKEGETKDETKKI